VWIKTGLVLGFLVYGAVVLMVVAGFTAAAPLLIVPLVIAALIGASNLLGGGRTHGRTPGRPVGGGQAPLSSSGDNGLVVRGVPDGQVPADGTAAIGEES
jgi:hypothetical protein